MCKSQIVEKDPKRYHYVYVSYLYLILLLQWGVCDSRMDKKKEKNVLRLINFLYM